MYSQRGPSVGKVQSILILEFAKSLVGSQVLRCDGHLMEIFTWKSRSIWSIPKRVIAGLSRMVEVSQLCTVSFEQYVHEC